MPRSDGTVSKCLLYNTAYPVTADVCDLDNGHEIDASEMAHDRLLIRFLGATTKYTATILAGAFSDASLGNLTFDVDTTETKVVCLEASRFLQSDGMLHIDIASDGAVTGASIEAYLLP